MTYFFPLSDISTNGNIHEDASLVTVVVISYNYGHFLEECLVSLSQQTLASEIKVLVIDSKSDLFLNESVLAIAKARGLGLNVSLLKRNSRHLLGCNRNFGIDQTRSPYVMFLDADDQLNPFYLELCLFSMIKRRVDIVGTGHLRFSSTGKFSRAEGMHRKPNLKTIEIDNVFGSQALIRKDIFDLCSGFNDTGFGPNLIYEDWRFFHKVLKMGGIGINLPVDLVRYRVHSESQSRQLGIPHRDTQSAAIRYLNRDFKASPKLVRRRRLKQIRRNSRNHLKRLIESINRTKLAYKLVYKSKFSYETSNIAILLSPRAGSERWFEVHRSLNLLLLTHALGFRVTLWYILARYKQRLYLLMLHGQKSGSSA